MPELFIIDDSRFNDEAQIVARLDADPSADRGSLRSALRYLYMDDGPVNLPRERLLAAEPYLEASERLVIRWLYTRTNGNLRSTYGAAALRAARSSLYRCEVCKFADVWVLNLDHVDGRVAGTHSRVSAQTATPSSPAKRTGRALAPSATLEIRNVSSDRLKCWSRYCRARARSHLAPTNQDRWPKRDVKRLLAGALFGRTANRTQLHEFRTRIWTSFERSTSHTPGLFGSVR